MKTVCPNCHSSNVQEITSEYSSLADELFAPTVLVSLSVSLCKSFKVHPAVGVVAGTALATLVQITKSNNGLPPLAQKQYRCDHCSHAFTL